MFSKQTTIIIILKHCIHKENVIQIVQLYFCTTIYIFITCLVTRWQLLCFVPPLFCLYKRLDVNNLVQRVFS